MSSQNPPRTSGRAQRLSQILLLTFLGLIVIPLVALAIIPTQVNANITLQEHVAELASLADSQVQVVSGWINATSQRVVELADAETLGTESVMLVTGNESGPLAIPYAAARDSFTSKAMAQSASFNRVIVLDMTGQVRGSSDVSLLNRNMGQETWFLTTTSSGNPGQATITGPLRDPIDGQESLYFSTPIMNDNGQLVGVLSARTDLIPLQGLMADVPLWGETSDAYLIGEGRQYISTPRLGGSEMIASDEIVGTALSGVDGSGEWTDYRGQLVIGAYRWIAPLNLALIVKQDRVEALATNQVLTRTILLVGVLLGALAIIVALLISRRINRALMMATETAGQIAKGDFSLRIPNLGIVEANQLAGAFNAITDRIQNLTAGQEEMIQARTRQLEVANRVGRVIAAETDLDRLLQLTVNAIHEQLGYYHAQVFLLDDLRQFAVLRTSMGDAGTAMLSRGHKLPVGSGSVVGQTVSGGEPVLASDTRHAEFWRPNPLLPRTRAELAIPLTVADQVTGVLDIQSTEPDVFDEATISLLQTVGDQLAVAIRNAQLFDEKRG